MNAVNVLFWFPLLLISLNEKQNEIQGIVTAVYDGNTLEVVTTENEGYRVVLAGIDCPELTQEYGLQAKALLERCAMNNRATVILQGKDRFANYVGVVLISGSNDVRLELLTEGLAWTSEKNPDEYLESLRHEAAAREKGLWRHPAPTAPWTHRREESMREAKSR